MGIGTGNEIIVDKTLNGIISDVHSEFSDSGVSREDITNILKSVFDSSRRYMKCGEFPRIGIPGLGYFRPSIPRVLKEVNWLDSQGVDTEDLCRIYYRIKSEKKRRQRRKINKNE